MNLVISGPQGSGKGTQSEMLADEFGFHYVDMGKIMRSVANTDNSYATIVKDCIDKGELVPDEYIRLVAWDYISKHDKEAGFLFDGYPRSVPQYEHLKDMLMKFGKILNHVIEIEISKAESVKRLSARRTCSKCGLIFNLLTNPSPNGGKCTCGGELIHREDDKPEAIKVRLARYYQFTIPVLDEARKDKILIEVNGERPIEEIHSEIVVKLGLKNG
jgi:adenylate kinase